MRRFLVVFGGAVLLAATAQAQTAVPDREALLKAALVAAENAKQAQIEAQAAADRAKVAAKEASDAAEALRAVPGAPVISAAPTPGPKPAPAAGVVAVATPARSPVPAPALAPTVLSTDCENIPVFGDVPAGCQAAATQRAITLSGVGRSVVNGPNSGVVKSTPTPDFQFVATSKEKVASISMSFNTSGIGPAGNLAAGQFTLGATSKLDDKGNSDVLGLSGFASGTELKFGYTSYFGRTNLTGKSPMPVIQAEALCKQRNPGAPDKLCDAEAYETGVTDFVAHYDDGLYRALINEVFPGPVKFFGVTSSVNFSNHKFIDRSVFKQVDQDKIGYSFGGYAGIIAPSGETMFDVAYTWKKQFKDKSATTLCPPPFATTIVECLTGPDGGPKMITQSIISVELRQMLFAKAGKVPPLALAPMISFDTKASTWEIDGPIYFVNDGAGKLRGGIRLHYLEGRDGSGTLKGDFTAGIFVGVPFSLFHDQ